MTVLIVPIIVLGLAFYQYFRGTLAKSLTMVFMLLFAAVVAFGFFEPVSNIFISRTSDYSRSKLYDLMQPVSFVLLFIAVFSALQTAASFLIKKHVLFGSMSEKIGRVILGAIAGLILSGIVVTALDMAPFGGNTPYKRFDSRNPNPENPAKAFLNTDSFVTGVFNALGGGSLKSNNSFAVIHPSLIDEFFLNRMAKDEDVSILTSRVAIKVPKKAAAWLAPETLTTTDGHALTPKTGHNLTIVRIGFNKNAVPFNLSQLRLICNKKNIDNPLDGRGKNVYAIGYLERANHVKQMKLTGKIDIEAGAFKDGVKWLDFVFGVPDDYVPVLAAFKQNSIVQIPDIVSADEAPVIKYFEKAKAQPEESKALPEESEIQPEEESSGQDSEQEHDSNDVSPN